MLIYRNIFIKKIKMNINKKLKKMIILRNKNLLAYICR